MDFTHAWPRPAAPGLAGDAEPLRELLDDGILRRLHAPTRQPLHLTLELTLAAADPTPDLSS